MIIFPWLFRTLNSDTFSRFAWREVRKSAIEVISAHATRTRNYIVCALRFRGNVYHPLFKISFQTRSPQFSVNYFMNLLPFFVIPYTILNSCFSEKPLFENKSGNSVIWLLKSLKSWARRRFIKKNEGVALKKHAYSFRPKNDER